MKRFVYKTTNLLNGKIYIGQHSTENLDDGYMGSGVYLQKAFEKHGEENFKREIIAWADTKENLNHAEEFFIKHYMNKVGKSRMYNVVEGASGGALFKGHHHTEETKLKMSEALKGRHHTEETRKKLSEAHKGISHSEETKLKMSAVLKGHPVSEETRQKISEANKGQLAWNKGIHHADETRKKISVACKNHPSFSKKVLCVETGEIYPSVSEAGRQTGIGRTGISDTCTGRQKTAGGYHWKYI